MTPHYTLTLFPAGRDQRSTLALQRRIAFLAPDQSRLAALQVARAMATELHRVHDTPAHIPTLRRRAHWEGN